MKIVIVGAGAMGSLYGSMLAAGENDVTLIDVWREAVEAINTNGLRVDESDGSTRHVKLRAVSSPSEVEQADLIIIFVKCYHTEDAARSLEPMLGADTVVLSLQNGWGNVPKLQAIVGAKRVLPGVSWHSATLVGPGHIFHAGSGPTVMGELDGSDSMRLNAVASAFRGGGIEVKVSDTILKEIWSKLALNVCSLPTAALLHFTAGELAAHDGTLRLMENLLREHVAVANAQGIPLDFDERWDSITLIARRNSGARASMLQDVEKRRQTEIDVINGAVVDIGKRLGIPTPYNDAMVWLVKALQETF